MTKDNFIRMNSSIKNLVFDLGGVLVGLDIKRCIEAFTKLGFTQAEALVQTYRQRGIFSDLETGQISTEVFCQSLRHDTRLNVSDDDLIEAWRQMLTTIPAARLEKLLSLREHYRLYLLSNTNVIHWQQCRDMFCYNGHQANDFFNDIFLSFEMHQSKPDAGIFCSVMNRTGIFPHETLLIDDSEANCNAARALGWQAHWVQPDEDWTTSLI